MAPKIGCVPQTLLGWVEQSGVDVGACRSPHRMWTPCSGSADYLLKPRTSIRMSSSIHRNFIAGEWLAGADAAANINPSDTRDVIGLYARASQAQARWAALTPVHR